MRRSKTSLEHLGQNPESVLHTFILERNDNPARRWRLSNINANLFLTIKIVNGQIYDQAYYLYGMIILVKAIPLCIVMAWLPFQKMLIYFTVFSVMHTTTGFHSLLTKWDGFWLTKDAFSFILGEGETRKFSFKDNNGCSPF